MREFFAFQGKKKSNFFFTKTLPILYKVLTLLY